jgi:Putative Ig domain
MTKTLRIIFSILALFCSVASARGAEMTVEDIFGRDLTKHGLILVDWEGPLANPAIRFYITPPADVALPARATLSSDSPRLYFDRPSTIGPHGPRKKLEFTKREKLPILVSVFDDTQGKDQELTLRIELQDSKDRKKTITLPCHVLDQDKEIKDRFPILIDYLQDRTGFFKEPKHREVIRQAADDWAYFFDPSPFNSVPAGTEKTRIWLPESFTTDFQVVNTSEYTGFLLYAYGIHTDEIRSSGEPSHVGGFQSRKGETFPIRRSGGLLMERRGNWNTRGWLTSVGADGYWNGTNLRDEPHDLYSIAHHELGHSLIFNRANPRFEKAHARGKFDDRALTDYLGGDIRIDKSEHAAGIVDPASRRGAFGNEYHGDMPYCRWQITKTDLLCAQAVGWPLRKTSAFVPLGWGTETLPAGKIGKEYSAKLQATGGIPFYCWDVTDGRLPPGLSLNSFSGAIIGTPTKGGIFPFTIRVRDYNEKGTGQSRTVRLEIGENR